MGFSKHRAAKLMSMAEMTIWSPPALGGRDDAPAVDHPTPPIPPIGPQPIGAQQVTLVRDELERWMDQTNTVRDLLKELQSVAGATPALQNLVPQIRIAVSALEMAIASMDPARLHVALTDYSRALGGIGVRYFR